VVVFDFLPLVILLFSEFSLEKRKDMKKTTVLH